MLFGSPLSDLPHFKSLCLVCCVGLSFAACQTTFAEPVQQSEIKIPARITSDPDTSTPGIQIDFESMPAGPLTEFSDESGQWKAADGDAVIHTLHSRSGIQSLRLLGGEQQQVIWTPSESEQQLTHLSLWFERWTRRTPWDFRVEAEVGGDWKTLHWDTSGSSGEGTAITGSFRNHLSLDLGKQMPAQFRFTCTTPENTGVMIDDVRLGAGDFQETDPTEIQERLVDGRLELDLFYNRMNGAANYRIPSLAVTTQGTILAVCDCRRDRAGDAPNNIDQVLRRSTDNGVTWSDVSTIVDYPGKRTAGDPSLTIDRVTGTIWLCYVYANEGVGLAGGRNEPGFGENTFHIHLRRSQDDGKTWSEPLDISSQIKPEDWHAIWTAPGMGIQTRDGRLMICFSGRKRNSDGSWIATSNIAFSDDHGESWNAFRELGLGTNESQVAELADGSYMINMRQNGGQARWVSISKDRGKTWSKQKQNPQLVEPNGCQASLISVLPASIQAEGENELTDAPEHKRSLLFCNPSDTKSRKNMTVKLSYDNGATWPVEKVIYAGPSAYSCMAVLPDGSIGLLYERDGRRVTFTKFTLDWLSEK